jgi:cytochrome c oxidase assembly factor CtaG
MKIKSAVPLNMTKDNLLIALGALVLLIGALQGMMTGTIRLSHRAIRRTDNRTFYWCVVILYLVLSCGMALSALHHSGLLHVNK